MAAGSNFALKIAVKPLQTWLLTAETESNSIVVAVFNCTNCYRRPLRHTI